MTIALLLLLDEPSYGLGPRSPWECQTISQEPAPVRRGLELGLRGGVVFVLDSSLSDAGPLYGGGLELRIPLPEPWALDAAVDFYFGSGRQVVTYNGTSVNATSDVNVYHLSLNLDWEAPGEHGPAAWAGIGVAEGYALAKATIMGFAAQKSFSDTSFTLQVGAGYRYRKAQLGFTLVWLPGSQTMDLAGVLGFSVRF